MKFMLDKNVVEYTDEETKKKYLVNPQHNEILEVNDTAEIILNYVKMQYEVDKIVSLMKEKFEDVSKEELERDVNMFFSDAVEHHVCINVVQTAG